MLCSGGRLNSYHHCCSNRLVIPDNIRSALYCRSSGCFLFSNFGHLNAGRKCFDWDYFTIRFPSGCSDVLLGIVSSQTHSSMDIRLGAHFSYIGVSLCLFKFVRYHRIPESFLTAPIGSYKKWFLPYG